MPRWAVVLFLLPALLPGCTQGDPGAAEPEWTEVVVPGRQMLDLGYVLASGTGLTWSWEASAPTAFQALYITGGTAYPLASEFGTGGAGERTTPQSGQYNLTWDNRGTADLTVRFVVRDGYEQRIWPPGSGPGCPPPPALLDRMC